MVWVNWGVGGLLKDLLRLARTASNYVKILNIAAEFRNF